MTEVSQLDALRREKGLPLQPWLEVTQWPAVLNYVDYLASARYPLTPRTIVREEKNKGTNYHTISQNITCHCDPLPEADLEHYWPTTFNLRSWSLVGHGSEFFNLYPDFALQSDLIRYHEVLEGEVNTGPVVTAPTGQAYALTYPAFTLRTDFPKLAGHDLAHFNALRVRMIELRASADIELYVGPQDAQVENINTHSLIKISKAYANFLLYIMRTYLDLRPVTLPETA